jgi:hypothetical protein
MQTSNQFPEEPEEKQEENVVEQTSSPLYEFSTPYVSQPDKGQESRASIAETTDASASTPASETEGQHRPEEDLLHRGMVYPPPPSFYQQAQFAPGQPLPQASMPMYPGMQPAQSAGYVPQGGYAGMQPPPFVPVPPMQPPPKKSYRWLWITISILVVLLLAACGFCGWAFSQFFTPIVQSETNAINVTNEYYDALHSNDYASAYQYLMPQGSIKGMALATFTQRAQAVDKQYGAVRSYTTGAVNIVTDSNTGLDFSRFTIVVNVTRPGQSYSVLLSLQKSGNDWKITDFDRL